MLCCPACTFDWRCACSAPLSAGAALVLLCVCVLNLWHILLCLGVVVFNLLQFLFSVLLDTLLTLSTHSTLQILLPWLFLSLFLQHRGIKCNIFALFTKRNTQLTQMPLLIQHTLSGKDIGTNVGEDDEINKKRTK